uniref:Uncharacterized protein n=1 Tax=Arundo donax TaxID=35708 RepID=A0A0A9FRB8_ARUDO
MVFCQRKEQSETQLFQSCWIFMSTLVSNLRILRTATQRARSYFKEVTFHTLHLRYLLHVDVSALQIPPNY